MTSLSEPQIGEHVRRLDDGRIGKVVHIAKAGDEHQFLMGAGDIEVRVDEHTSIIACGTTFWHRWERVDYRALADQAIRIALQEGA